MSQLPHVLVVEDDRHTRNKICDAITQSEQFHLIGACATFAEARFTLENGTCDVLLVDLGLPDGSGIDLIRQAASRFDDVHIMVISVFGDERHVVDAIEAGANGYLLKDSNDEQIVAAIDQLLDGGAPITPSVAVYLLKRFQNGTTASSREPGEQATLLTERERDVLQLIAKGLTYSEVGGNLNVSINTIRVHMKNLFRKLSVNSRSEAVFEAIEQGHIKI